MKKNIVLIMTLLFSIIVLLVSSCDDDDNCDSFDVCNYDDIEDACYMIQISCDSECNKMTVFFPSDPNGNFRSLVKLGKPAVLAIEECGEFPEPNLENDCEGGWPEADPKYPGLPGTFVDYNTAVFELCKDGGIGLPALISENGEIYSVNIDRVILIDGPIIMSKECSDGLLYWGTAQIDGSINYEFSCE